MGCFTCSDLNCNVQRFHQGEIFKIPCAYSQSAHRVLPGVSGAGLDRILHEIIRFVLGAHFTKQASFSPASSSSRCTPGRLFTINHSHPKLHISQPPQQQHQQVRAIHAFTGDPFANQLAFSAGTVLLVRDPTRTANGWAFGEVVDGMGRRTGWFPVNYVPPRRRPSRAVHGANVGGNQYRIAWRIFSIPLRPVGLVAAGALAAKHAMDSHNDRQNKPGS
jgi:hypothetical protein